MQAENSGDTESDHDAEVESEALGVFETETLELVAVANESALPTHEETEEIAEIRANLGLGDEDHDALAEVDNESVEGASLFSDRAKELLLGDSLTSSEIDNPLPLEEILANLKERGTLEDELFSKMSQGEIDENEKALLLEMVSAQAKWLTPTGVVKDTSLRGNIDIKASMLRGIGNDPARALDRKVVESWE